MMKNHENQASCHSIRNTMNILFVKKYTEMNGRLDFRPKNIFIRKIVSPNMLLIIKSEH